MPTNLQTLTVSVTAENLLFADLSTFWASRQVGQVTALGAAMTATDSSFSLSSLGGTASLTPSPVATNTRGGGQLAVTIPPITPGCAVMIDAEVVRVQTITGDTDNGYTVTVDRFVPRQTPVAHAAGTAIYLLTDTSETAYLGNLVLAELIRIQGLLGAKSAIFANMTTTASVS